MCGWQTNCSGQRSQMARLSVWDVCFPSRPSLVIGAGDSSRLRLSRDDCATLDDRTLPGPFNRLCSPWRRISTIGQGLRRFYQAQSCWEVGDWSSIAHFRLCRSPRRLSHTPQIRAVIRVSSQLSCGRKAEREETLHPPAPPHFPAVLANPNNPPFAARKTRRGLQKCFALSQALVCQLSTASGSGTQDGRVKNMSRARATT